MKMYAYWEKSSTGNWGLVVYHGEKPRKSSQGAVPEQHGPFDVPEDMIDVDTPNMGRIAAAFPNPFKVEPKDEEKIQEPLPDWALRASQEGVLEDMVQLITKDAKARGNATLAAQMPDVDKFLVVTDANNWTTYTLNELLWAYEIGPYILREFPNPKSTASFNDLRTFL